MTRSESPEDNTQTHQNLRGLHHAAIVGLTDGGLTFTLKSKRRRSADTCEPRCCTEAPRTFLRAKFRMCVAVCLTMQDSLCTWNPNRKQEVDPIIQSHHCGTTRRRGDVTDIKLWIVVSPSDRINTPFTSQLNQLFT